MNKAELVEVMAEKAGINKKQAAAALDAFTTTVINAVASGNHVQLVGFGTFEQTERAARAGRNPQTGEAVDIPACKVPKFKAGKVFKDAVKA